MHLSADQEKFAKQVAQAVAEWWSDLGVLAWLAIGAVFLVGILACLVMLRCIYRGHLAEPPKPRIRSGQLH